MTDYFALLDQPRAPWLEPDKLKNAYHQKTLLAHPDTQTNRQERDSAESIFANLNEAYQVLQDPKRRLQHLLTLEGISPPSNESIPQQLVDLFLAIGTVTQRANLLFEKLQATSNKLSRSLLRSEILEVQTETKAVRGRVQSLLDAALNQLHQINTAWGKDPTEQISVLSNLYLEFAYLTRWSRQLDEILFQLSLDCP